MNIAEYDIKKALSPVIQEIKEIIDIYKSDSEKQTPIIGIAGCKGVGKSYFTCTLETLLQEENLRTIIVKQNGFIPHSEMYPEALADIQPRLRWKDVHYVLEKIKNKALHVEIPFRNKKNSPFTIEYQNMDFSNSDLVIFDGTFSLTGSESYNFFSHVTVGIFLESIEHNIAEWRWQRHSRKPIESQQTKEVFNVNLAKDMEIYHTHILPTKKNARFVIHKDEHHRYTVERTKK